MVSHRRPPITTRPIGPFFSPPSPSPSDIGTMPIIIASAVMSTGRKRVLPASIAARMGSPCSSSCVLAQDNTRVPGWKICDDHERVEPGLEVHHDKQVDERDGEAQSGE